MIPNRITLKNFMCYKDASLDLSGVHLACLSGDNGAGKSTILDAITWALWGKARAGDDDLISQGEIESQIDFEFSIGNSQYRVNRRRTRKSSGQTSLQFYGKKEDGSWSNISESGVRAIEKQITTTVRTSYDTFVNSAFLLQGNADSFTVKTATERKKVLAEILELGQYDIFEKQFKELSKEADLQRKALVDTLKELEAEISRKPEYEREKQLAQAQLEAEQNPLKRQEEELNLLKSRQNQLQSSQQKLNEAQKRLKDLHKELDRLQLDKEKSQRNLKISEEILLRRAEIESGHARWSEARQTEELFSDKLIKLDQLKDNKTSLERTIEREKHRLHSTIEQRLSEQATLLRIIEKLPAQLAELDKLKKEFEVAKEAKIAFEAAREERANRQGDLKQAEGEVKRLNDELPKIEKKAKRIPKAGDKCDQCGTVLDETARDHNVEEYRKEYRNVQEQVKEAKARAETISAEIAEFTTKMNGLEKNVARYDELKTKIALLEKEITTGKESEQQNERLKGELTLLQTRQQTQDFAKEEQAKLVMVDKEIVALDYNAEAHKQVRERRAEFAHYEAEHKRLESAGEIVIREKESLERYARDETRYLAELQREDSEINRLTAEIKDLPALEQNLSRLTQEIRDSKERQAKLNRHIGEMDGKIKDCEQKAVRKEELEKQHELSAQDRSIYNELAEAFGKKGIQAMVIDAALPEIEDEANRLLSGMTDGRMNVRFDTQREGRKGEAIETLELYISDEQGARPYELFSGGEAFRVNFAVRVALSKLLARRSGAQLRTLFIDEGFGSQDGQGRERIVDAIRGIEQDFDRILVITHIQELKDVFPVRIDVVKTATGSQISIN